MFLPLPQTSPSLGDRRLCHPAALTWLTHAPLFPGVQSPHVQSSNIKGWLFTVKNSLPAGFLELLDSLSAFQRQSALLPGRPTVREESLGHQVWASKGITGLLRLLASVSPPVKIRF